MAKYEKGMVFMNDHVVFKDSNEPDPKADRPVVLPVSVSDDGRTLYYLTLTSNTDRYFESPQMKAKYYLVKANSYNMLRFSSLVNLESIYKEEAWEDVPTANLQQDEMKKLVRKLKEYQAVKPDDLYVEIYERL